ncbi:G-type lectin S-receptor-like serine/threonine-protein kinase At2g19130 [Cryptomeria japonica]|uniref:G-type lectin S-receptor-like serine/threonine-protein kinase At2g19130 n=1 Tax=Cryptomeria japonica TaxID=3369 RepID=UPI0027DA41ED|nr:G-type lectin S-receptor-like serine/threonine-protein kinase At2g19130 [Cryptomeria japonica]
MVREVLNRNGEISVYYWTNDNSWSPIWFQPESSCGVYGVCGAYGVYFTRENIQSRRCMEGFHPRNAAAWSSQEWWSSGCVRRTPLNCAAMNRSVSGTTDGFLQVMEPTRRGCKTACLNNCSCAFTDSNSVVCKLWFGDLVSMRDKATSSDGQPLFIPLAASVVSHLSAQAGRSRSRVVALCISIPLGVAILSSLFIGACFIQRRHRRLLQKVEEYDAPTSLRTFTYKELKIATNNFAHKLGTEAFGCVFKATLPDNTLVAVKRLEDSAQVEKQFLAEISTIGNIHHMNLVRLRGFCVEGSKMMIVYEYMQNGSLNSFMSYKSKEEDKVLEWNTRFGIALGTAMGLLYLHEECRDRIIHSDIKPENVLLHADFSAKVAHFGLAKLVGKEFSRVLTTTRGTRGYLPPEWLTLLEIISGRRNSDLSVQDSQRYFPTWAAVQIRKGNTISIVDERIAYKAYVEEVIRSVVISILCNPTMAQVVQILEGKSEGNVEKYKRCLQALIDDHCLYYKF